MTIDSNFMLRKNFYILTFLVLTSTFLVAQNNDYGKVSKEELTQAFSSVDSTASAEYLYKYRKTYFNYVSGVGFNLITNVHERIKIYNKEGFEYATKKIRLYKDGNEIEDINKLKAKTYNLIDDKVEETPLKKEGKFKIELSENVNEESFTMPNIKEGSIIEYKYSINSPFIYNIDEFVFQHDIPVKKIEVFFEAPEYFVFRMNVKGFLNVMPKREQFNKSLDYTQRVASGGTTNAGAGQGLGRTTQVRGNIKYMSNVISYDLYNIEPLKEEPFVNELSNYRSGVKYELSYTRFPNSSKEFYSRSWEDVVESVYKNPNFGDELKKTNYFKDDLDSIIKNLTDEQEKLNTIFSFVKSKVKWDQSYGKYTKKGVKQAYQKGIGNTAEINLMLTAMLDYANLESNPVLVSTRSNGMPLFPTREGYNYIVSSVKLNGKVILLDATSQNSLPGVLPVRTLNWEGRMILKDGKSSIVNLYPTNMGSIQTFQNVILKEDGSAEGKIRNVYKEHNALSFRDKYSANKQESYLSDLVRQNDGIEINDFEVKNVDNLAQLPIESYGFITESEIDAVSDKIYFSPLLFLATKENPFKQEKREFPIDFSFPFENISTSIINLPKGYVVESVPESIAIALPNDLGNFSYTIKNVGNVLQLKVLKKINYPVLPAEYYLSLKEYYGKMIEKLNEKVVLTKV
ncbi:transglutaminase [Maribacter aquivivus]|uniref:transglutaminase n=1 Tax=Maribacter aquivivus TaxID=228958 RepID=UPI002490D978|nr:transglutaminase [Maribacter aquivivus]